jgi:preprotein translocase subunit SecY
MRHVQWKPEEVNKDLRKRGIYINGISPGRPTRSLLKLIINKMVFL